MRLLSAQQAFISIVIIINSEAYAGFEHGRPTGMWEVQIMQEQLSVLLCSERCDLQGCREVEQRRSSRREEHELPDPCLDYLSALTP